MYSCMQVVECMWAAFDFWSGADAFGMLQNRCAFAAAHNIIIVVNMLYDIHNQSLHFLLDNLSIDHW